MTRKVINQVSKAGFTRIGEETLRWASRQTICGCGWADIEFSETQGHLKVRCIECGAQVEIEPCIAAVPDLLAALEALVEAVDKLDGVQDAAIDIWISNCTESAIKQARAALAGARGAEGGE